MTEFLTTTYGCAGELVRFSPHGAGPVVWSVWQAVTLHAAVNAVVPLQALSTPVPGVGAAGYRLLLVFSVPLGARRRPGRAGTTGKRGGECLMPPSD
jgi:hypothetical protein